MLDKTPFKFMGSQGVDFWIAKGRNELLSRYVFILFSSLCFHLQSGVCHDLSNETHL